MTFPGESMPQPLRCSNLRVGNAVHGLFLRCLEFEDVVHYCRFPASVFEPDSWDESTPVQRPPKKPIACPECGTLAATDLGSTSTAMHSPSFTDEQGVWHLHDLNSTCTRFMCKNGHVYRVVNRGSCHCGWSGGERVIAPGP